jgi:hypothetical protein
LNNKSVLLIIQKIIAFRVYLFFYMLLLFFYNCSLKAQWVKTTIDNRNIKTIFIKDSIYLAGTDSYGLYRSEDKGNTWYQVQNGPNVHISIYSITKADGYYFCTSNLVDTIAYRSTDLVNWQGSYNNSKYFPAAMLYNQGILFIGTILSGVYRSNDYGLTWTLSGASPFTGSFISTFAANDQFVFAGTEGNCRGVWGTSDNGLTWDNCNIGLPIDPYNVWYDIHCMLTFKNLVFAGTSQEGIYVSTNNGTFWSATNNGLPKVIGNVNSLINIDDMIVTACSIGIFKSIDQGKTWSAVTGYQSGLFPISLAYDSDYLYAGMVDNGIWRLPLAELTGIQENIITPIFDLFQNYPNPFNPNTTISYSIPVASNIKLVLYNALGQTVKVLVNGYKQAGNYSVNFNASDLPSGIYFYRLEEGQFSQVKKMILIK